MGIIGKVFEVCYDFVANGGLKKALVAVFALSLIMLTTGYLVYPQTTTSVALSVVGATPEGQFEPPEISGEDNVEYVGTFEGSAGPVGMSVKGEIFAEVNFETGEVTARAEGVDGKVSDGYLEGKIDLVKGSVGGDGRVNALGLTGVPLDFKGDFNGDATRAEGTWVGTGEISGSGTWEVEVVDEADLEFEELDEDIVEEGVEEEDLE